MRICCCDTGGGAPGDFSSLLSGLNFGGGAGAFGAPAPAAVSNPEVTFANQLQQLQVIVRSILAMPPKLCSQDADACIYLQAFGSSEQMAVNSLQLRESWGKIAGKLGKDSTLSSSSSKIERDGHA